MLLFLTCLLIPVQRMVSSRILNSSTAEKFADALNLQLSPHNGVDSQPIFFFNNYCLSILDEICLVKMRRVSASKSPPWLNGSIPCLKRDCRKAERRWRKTHLNVHLLYLKDLLISFNNAIRDARAAYFSHLVTKSRGNPTVLFNTISDIVNPALPAAPISSNEDCENFLSFLLAKINNVRINFSHSAPVMSISTPSWPSSWILSLLFHYLSW